MAKIEALSTVSIGPVCGSCVALGAGFELALGAGVAGAAGVGDCWFDDELPVVPSVCGFACWLDVSFGFWATCVGLPDQ